MIFFKQVSVPFILCPSQGSTHSGQIGGKKQHNLFKAQIFNFQNFFMHNFDILNILCCYIKISRHFYKILLQLLQ
jgi:hypothetical protein